MACKIIVNLVTKLVMIGTVVSLMSKIEMHSLSGYGVKTTLNVVEKLLVYGVSVTVRDIPIE